MCLTLRFCALLVIISYRPGDDQFWIGCTMASAERYFFPLLFNRYMRTAYSVSDEIPAFKAFYEKWYGQTQNRYKNIESRFDGAKIGGERLPLAPDQAVA